MADEISGVGTGVGTGGSYVALPQAVLEVYSADILHQSMGVMRYETFAVQKTELSVTPGQVIKFTTYNNITRGGALAEEDKLTTQKMSASQKSCTVTEYGNAIAVSEKLLQLSWDDVLKEAAFLLGRDYGLVTDLMLRDVVRAGGSTLFTTPGAAALGQVAAADYFDIETLRLGIEQLMTANAPKFNNDFYVCFAHPHQIAYLKRDPDWVSANNYANTRRLFTGEVGRWEDTIFIATTHQGNGAAPASDAGYVAAYANAGLGGQHLYQATLLADQSYGFAVALPVEMRDNGVEDFGRKHGLAWYSIYGGCVLNDEYIVHMISS